MANKKYKQRKKIDDADPQGMSKIDASKLGTISVGGIRAKDLGYEKGVRSEYPYPGFALEKKYQRQQTVEQNPKKYTKGSTSRKADIKDE